MQRALIFAGCLLLISGPARADHFYTWVDAQGHLHSTRIEEPKNPIVERAEAVKKQEQQEEKQQKQKQSGDKATAQTAPPSTDESRAATVRGVPKKKGATTVKPEAVSIPSPNPSSAPQVSGSSAVHSKAISPTPASKTSAPVVTNKSTPHETPAQRTSAAASSDSQYNLKNYPDGEDLAKHGYVRDPNHRPFYDWIDAMGVHHITEYQPPPDIQTENEVSGKQGTPAATQKSHSLYTQARVLFPGMGSGIPKGANPAAVKLLGLDKTPSLFANFASHCCSQLARADSIALPQGRSVEIKLDDGTGEHKFSSGKSRYRWVKLPAAASPYDLNIRSFIHHGVFIPSLVFLTSDLKITRVMTDLVLDYVPENWYRYGYLHARIRVHPEKGERWLLIYTRRKDVKDQTVVDEGNRRLSIPHKATGGIALEKLSPGSKETASLW